MAVPHDSRHCWQWALHCSRLLKNPHMQTESHLQAHCSDTLRRSSALLLNHPKHLLQALQH